ncbi:MAG: Zn-dependent hydrolase [Haloferacaceae archaeon]
MDRRDVDMERVERRLDDVWDIGRDPEGGVTRLAYSAEETEAIDYVREELPAEFAVATDPMGNVYATSAPDADRSVHVGSHLDSVANGGRFDGALGVVAALECADVLHAMDSPSIPVTVTVFRGEESYRFDHACIGSRGAVGELPEETLEATDRDGRSVRQAMDRVGVDGPQTLGEPLIDLDSVAGFLELHPEQGRTLDRANEHVGVVTSIRAPTRYRVTVEGEHNHSGATAMADRADAVAATGEMIWAIERIAKRAASEGNLVATTGEVESVDGAIGNVCGEATFSLDIRSTDAAYRDEVERRILDSLRSIADRRGVSVDAEFVGERPPVDLDERLVSILDEAAEALGTPHRRMPSGAGHDAMFAQIAGVPTGLVFVPSVDGQSHNPRERTPSEAIEDAIAVLLNAIAEFTGRRPDVSP